MKHSYNFLSSVSHIKNKVWTHIFHYNDSIFETEKYKDNDYKSNLKWYCCLQTYLWSFTCCFKKGQSSALWVSHIVYLTVVSIAYPLK